MTVPLATLGHARADLTAARQVAFNKMMAASKDAQAAWNRNDGAAQIAADINYDAACQMLATIDQSIVDLGES